MIWSNIFDQIPKKDNKNTFIFWWISGIGLVLLSIYALNISSSKESIIANTKIDSKSTSHHITNIEKTNSPIAGNIEHTDRDNTNKIKVRPQRQISSPSIVRTQEDNRNQSKAITKANHPKEITRNGNQHENLSPPISNRHNTDRSTVENQSRKTNATSLLPPLPFNQIYYTSQKTWTKNKHRNRRKLTLVKSPHHFWDINYATGVLITSFDQSESDKLIVEDGKEHYSHGLNIDYGYFLTSRLYTKLSVSMDRSYKKYTASLSRDTIVPSSQGNQILSNSTYVNGAIDTESGIPTVKAKIKRSVVNLNTFTTINIGVGLGYLQPTKYGTLHVEASLLKSVYSNIEGLGNEKSVSIIKDLQSLKDYYSRGPKYGVQLGIGADISLGNGMYSLIGLQYNYGFTNQLSSTVGHDENHSTIRASLGIRKMLFQ